MSAKKKMEGDAKQRRREARAAREAGIAPSAAGVSLGASKQRRSVRQSRSFVERLTSIRRGKQRVIQQNTPEANPGSGHPTSEATPKKRASRSARPSARKRSARRRTS